ncbi:AarF/ABC1/UbiB kinase family protein [Pelagicoccus sp. SDUM812003]|uniref:ABC1 kinase family protein n=1 Tax=Pelagicoccus sp. SDUM812003 TaxID=3041267 RepID=UPI00280FE238|nr:AarF/ABC1/UbiB kinase family protein [Pelagicoccus sp. SDUM812003]MDQ8203977.1 AarF/ABC1/UbiB kinase family protein [Pelagicoccus sp. SDUM812003]
MKLLPQHLVLYKKIAWLFVRHAKPAIVEQTNFANEADCDEASGGDPEEFVDSLEKMGPTFVKLGQLLSTRGDLMPLRFITALERLQDNVDPVDFATVREVVEQQLGVRISKAFSWFSEQPVASASLGQVHRARMRDGREVVVKVQRPNVLNRISTDLDALEAIANYADDHTELGKKYRFSGIIEQFRRSLIEELDYECEAQNLWRMKNVLERFSKLFVPQPIEGFFTRKVLTMEYVDGMKVTELSGVSKTEFEGESLAEELFKAYLHQVLVEGFYHSDPHPGNLLITPDHRAALIDLGMVGRLSESMQDNLFGLLTAISENDSDRVGEVALRMSDTKELTQPRSAFLSEIADLVGRSHDAAVRHLQFGSVVMEVMRICAEYGLRIPREISMLGKTLLNLDRIGQSLAMDFNPRDCISKNLNSIARSRSFETLKRGSAISLLLEFKELVAKSPQRLNDLLAILSENRLRLDVDAVDEAALIQGFQKIANRIALGAIIGALIVGASLMMDIDSSFTVWGYPGFPMLLFLVSGFFGLLFILSILRHDE